MHFKLRHATTQDNMTSPSGPPPPPPRRVLPRGVRVTLLILGLLALVPVFLGACLEFPAGVRWVAQTSLDWARPLPGARLLVGGARGGFLSGIELHDLNVVWGAGLTHAHIDTLRVTYVPSELLGRPIRARGVRVAGLSFVTTPELDGLRMQTSTRPADSTFALDLDRLELARGAVTIVQSNSSRSPAGIPNLVGARAGDVNVRLEGLRVRGSSPAFASSSILAQLFAPGDTAVTATLTAGAALEPGWIRKLDLHLDFATSHLALAGSVDVPSGERFALDHTDIRLRLAPLSGSDLRRFVPEFAHASDLSLDTRLLGQGDSITFSAVARAADGARLDAGGRASIAAGRPAAVRLRANVTGVDAGSWSTMDPGALILAGAVEADLSGSDVARLNGPLDISLEAAGTRHLAHPVHARLSARFKDGEATGRAEAALDQLTLHAAGTIRPLGKRIACDLDLEADVPPFDPSWREPGAHGRPLLAGRLIGSVQAKRDSGAQATGRAEVSFEPQGSNRSLIGPGRLNVTLGGGAIQWQSRLAIEAGMLTARGDIVPGQLPRYSIQSADAHAVPLGALLGDSLASTLDATLSLAGRGFSPATARLSGVVAPLTLTRGAHVAHFDSLQFALHDDRLEVHSRGVIDGTSLEARGWMHPATPPIRAAGFALRFEGLDGSRFRPDTLVASRLDGSLECTLAAPDLGEWLSPATIPPARAAQAEGTLHLALTPSEWRRDRITSLVFDAALSAGLLRYQGRLESTFGRASWTGDARPFGHEREARLTALTLEDVDLARLLAAPMPHTRIGGRISAEGSGASVDSLDARWGVALDGSSVGQGRVGRLRLSGNLVRGAMDARFEADHGPDSVLARVAARIQSGRRGQGWIAAGRIQAGARFGGASVDTVSGEFALEGGVLRIPRLEIAGNVMKLSAHGRVALGPDALGDSTDLHVTGSARNLKPLGERLGIEPLQAGTGEFALSATGPRDAMKLSGWLTATRLKAGRTRADSVDVRMDALARGDSIVHAQARAYAHGLLPGGMQEREVEATLIWNGRELGLVGHAQLNIGGTQDVALRLARGGGIAKLWVDRAEMQRGETHFALEQPAIIEFGHDAVTVDHLGLMQDGRRCLLASGSVRDDPDSALTVAIDSLDIAAPLAWLDLPGLRGRLSAAAELRGPRRSPAVNGWLRGNIATERGRLAHLEGDLAWKADSLVGGLRFAQSDHQWIGIRARVPLGLNLDPQPGERMLRASEGDFGESLEARQFDFAWFQSLISARLVRNLRGRMDGSVHAEGSTARPIFDGELHIRHARAQIPQLATTFESKDVGLVFDKRSIVLGPSMVTAGGGRLELQGRATFEGPGYRTFESRATFSKFRFINTGLAKLELSGELRGEGHLGSPTVTGTLEMANSTVYAEAGSNDRKLERVELTEDDWRELEARFSEADVVSAVPFRGLSDSLRCDVTIKLGRNVWVRRRSDPIVALELSGQVRVTREPAEQPEIAGRIDVQTGRSYLSFLNRRFDLTQARVDLPGPIPKAHAELEAQYLPNSSGTGGSSGASGPDVTALVTLNADGARVDLHSTPFMEHAALVNYLATGETQGEMSSGTAYGLAVGSVLGTVGGSAGRSLGLDVVQVTQDAYGGQTLSAGSHVKPQLYLGFRQPVVQGQQSSSRGENSTYTTEFEVEVEAGKRMLMNVQGGGSQYRFLLRPRLGK
jgi:autotransporter translocation and assembly factor TamB